jgi:repressor LexA
LPLLGRIAAGSPILATENVEEHVHIDASMFNPHADFLLRVRGDSMQEANILDRDLLAVHRTSQARNGQIVVARIDDEATVKYYERHGELIHLKAANSDYSAIEVDLRRHEFSIEGLAVGVIRTGFGSSR